MRKLLPAVFATYFFCIYSPGQPVNFPTAVQGAGSSTEIVFFLGDSVTTSQSAVFAAFLSSGDGALVEQRQAIIGPNGNGSFLFEGDDGLTIGHIDFVAPADVVATAILHLKIPGQGSVAPIGVSPAPECGKPAAALIRNNEFDTGIALSSRQPVPVTCDYDVYLSGNGDLVDSDTIVIVPFGQWQDFPLNRFQALAGQHNIQFVCSDKVHPFSLFQRTATGEIFSNGTGCLDE